MKYLFRFLIIAVLALTALVAPPRMRHVASAQGVAPEDRAPVKMGVPDVVFVATPHDVISRMLQVAGVRKEDMVYDLGCGDARMLVLASQKYGVRGIGYDIDPERVIESRQNVAKNNLQGLVKIIQEDIFTLDLEDADVILLYLHPEIMHKLIPQIEKMKPGSRIVCHQYGLPEIYKPDQKITLVSNEDSAEHYIAFYTTPLQIDFDSPLANIEQALKLDPNDAKAYFSRGNLHFAQNAYDLAIADYTRVIQIDSSRAAAYHNRGIVYMDKNDFDRAIDDFDQVIRLDADDSDAYFSRGSAYLMKGVYDRAIADLDKAIMLDPTDDVAYFTRGEAHFGAGSYDLAIADYEAALRIDPDYIEAGQGLENARKARGK